MTALFGFWNIAAPHGTLKDSLLVSVGRKCINILCPMESLLVVHLLFVG